MLEIGFFLTKIVENLSQIDPLFFVKLQIPAMKTLCNFGISGNFCLSNTTSCANLSIETPGLHRRERFASLTGTVKNAV